MGVQINRTDLESKAWVNKYVISKKKNSKNIYRKNRIRKYMA